MGVDTMNFKQLTLVSCLVLCVLVCGGMSAVAATPPALGTAENFAVLGGSTVTNTGSSVLTGDLGVWPGLAITGFPPGVVNGTTHAGDAVALQAQSDLVTAYNDLAGQACDTDLTSQNLGGLTLTPGAYCFSTSAQLTGTLTLDAQGDPNAVFVFQIGSTLTTASSSVVQLINGGSNCNVFWQIGTSATLGSGSTLAGSILALTSITLNTSASVSGQLLARNGAVTLDTNSVSVCIPVCPLITLSPITLPSGTQPGVPYSVVISATGGALPYTYAVTGGTLPPGLTLDSNTGLLSGTPTASGTWVFTVTATDANSCTGFRVYTITVNPIGCPTLTILPATLPNMVVGAPYSEPITASGSVPDTYTYSVTLGALPPGLGLNPTTPPAIKTVDLSGTPTTTGPYSFTITATDSNGCQVSQAYAVLVNPAACPTITVSPATLPNIVEGVPYSETISATGGVMPYTFTVTAGLLPPLLTLDPNSGIISGTPTEAGNFSFTVTATDANGCPGTQDYVMAVRGALNVPMLSGWSMALIMILVGMSGVAVIRRYLV
jgi:type VI secretion system secreted protein VgrG